MSNKEDYELFGIYDTNIKCFLEGAYDEEKKAKKVAENMALSNEENVFVVFKIKPLYEVMAVCKIDFIKL